MAPPGPCSFGQIPSGLAQLTCQPSTVTRLYFNLNRDDGEMPHSGKPAELSGPARRCTATTATRDDRRRLMRTYAIAELLACTERMQVRFLPSPLQFAKFQQRKRSTVALRAWPML